MKKKVQSSVVSAWKTYGGFRAIIRSPFFWVAVGLTPLSFPLWDPSRVDGPIWVGLAFTAIPNLIGLSLGGMAILLALGNKKLIAVATKQGNPESLFMKTMAAFVHFIVVQTSALLLGILAYSFKDPVQSAIGFFCFVYGGTVTIAIALNLYGIARIFNATGSLEAAQKKPVVDPDKN